MQPVFPSQIVNYLDSRYPQAKEQLEGRGSQFYLQRDHAPAAQQLLSMVENIPSNLLSLNTNDHAEFGEALAAIRFAINAWNSGDNHYKLKKIPGRQKMHPFTLLRKHLIKLKDEEIMPQIGEGSKTLLSEQQIHKLYGAIRSEFINLPTQAIRNVAAAAGIDVTRITSKAEKRSGLGSRAELMPQIDQLFGQMGIKDKIIALRFITQQLVKDSDEMKENVQHGLNIHGFQFVNNNFMRLEEGASLKEKAEIVEPEKDKSEGMIDKVKDPRIVFVVHGRNEQARRALFSFLRSLGLNPKTFGSFISTTQKACPYVGDILDKAFSSAQAVVVLMTPDDEARLRKVFTKPDDPEYEKELTPQARANVLFEAGMAFGRFPDRTVLVEIGNLRPFSDVGGRHVVKLDNSTEKRQDLAMRLKNARCPVDITSNTDWHTEGDFEKALEYASDESPSAIAPQRKLLICSNLTFDYEIIEKYKSYFSKIDQVRIRNIGGKDLDPYNIIFLLPSELQIGQNAEQKIIKFIKQGGIVFAVHDTLHYMFENHILERETGLKLNLGSTFEEIELTSANKNLDIEPFIIHEEYVSLEIDSNHDLDVLMIDEENKPALVNKILGEGFFIYFKYGHNLKDLLRDENISKMIINTISMVMSETK